MKAIIRTRAGSNFSTMQVVNIASPVVKPGEVKVKMVSSRINPVDMDLMKGFPSLKYKNPQIGGIDGAGFVTEVGEGVTELKVGEGVFFYRLFTDIGTWAEEITIRATDCARVPEHIDLKEAGSIALPLLTAYDSLQQLGPRRGEKILIHGAGGGVGFQALQVARQMGLVVTGTGGRKDRADLERAGLNQFIDYQAQDFSQILKNGEVDYVFDTMGGEILRKSIALNPKKVISLKFADPALMHKAGVKLPGFMKWIMKLMMVKFERMAGKHHVVLIGQVTGADGKMLQKAIGLINENFISRTYPTKTFTEIIRSGLTKNDVGKIIVFS